MFATFSLPHFGKMGRFLGHLGQLLQRQTAPSAEFYVGRICSAAAAAEAFGLGRGGLLAAKGGGLIKRRR